MKDAHFSKKKIIAYNFLSSRDTESLKTPLHFSRQDASEYVFGDLQKSILFLTTGQDFWPWHYAQILRPYRKYVESKFKKGVPTQWGIWNNTPAGTPFKYKIVSPPYIVEYCAESSVSKGLQFCGCCATAWIIALARQYNDEQRISFGWLNGYLEWGMHHTPAF